MSSLSAWKHWARKMMFPLLVALSVGLIGLSPVAMTWMADLPVQWSHLSDMGQAYGGTSAVLSGLALAGVSASLLMQSSLNRISQLHSIRQRQFDIVKLALDNPTYLYVDGSAALADPDNPLKVYANLFVGHWAMVWDLAEMREETLHVVASRLFESAVAREWWKVNGQSYYSSRRRKKFVAILSDECDRAALTARESSPGTAPAPAPIPTHRPPSAEGRSRTLAIGVVAGIGIGVLLRSATRRRRVAWLASSRR
ncbi:DUF6082 family protein [Micromonospora sp. NPDC000442]|uniref:DUF6082 family protein n=1 Tax=Micromonospora sp. NPDC000442 TaxID=3364217 RepID=UPI0036B56B57